MQKSKTFIYITLYAAVMLFTSGLIIAQNFTTGRNSPTTLADRQSSGSVFIDYDMDGDLDLFVSNVDFQNVASYSINSLFKNDGSGNYTAVTEGTLVNDMSTSYGSSWADYDNDGDMDVYVSGENSYLHRNDGGDVFVKVTEGDIGDGYGNRGWACAWGDYDNDGHVDLIVTHAAGFVTPAANTTNHLLHNNGNGTFTKVEGTVVTQNQAAYTTPTWFDYDDDGDIDLFIAIGPADGTTVKSAMYKNMLKETGTASFEVLVEPPLTEAEADGQTVNFADIDNDGILDCYFTSFYPGTSSYLFKKFNGSFIRVGASPLATDPAPSLASTFGDYDNDGDLDVVVSSGATIYGSTTNRYYQNDGQGNFTLLTDVGNLSTHESNGAWGGSNGDIDNDGDLDLYIPTIGSQTATAENQLYKNNLSNTNSWLNIRLTGVESNRAAIGAKVYVMATVDGTAKIMRRDISAQNTFSGHNSLRAHFGLGDAQQADTVRIVWPSGYVNEYYDVEVNQFLNYEEMENVTSTDDDLGAVPNGFKLEQNYPNPFNPSTRISFSLPVRSFVSLKVYDVTGRLIKSLLSEEFSAGQNFVTWNGTDDSGKQAASGVYLYRLDAFADNNSSFSASAKMILLK